VISYWLIGSGLAFLLVSVLWLVVPALYGVPWVPTREARIRRALQLAKLQPGEILYDLGAGDGRVLLMAAKEFSAQAVGIEIGPAQCALGWLRIWFSGSRDRVRMRCANFYKADIHSADVVFVYLTSSQTPRLAKKLAKELRPGARVVSVAADFPDWHPELVDREMLIFVYQMPPVRLTEHVLFSKGVK
jgi:cyclopropane fatty-acyl-phospholipid synthase-like methyltransferase